MELVGLEKLETRMQNADECRIAAKHLMFYSLVAQMFINFPGGREVVPSIKLGGEREKLFVDATLILDQTL